MPSSSSAGNTSASGSLRPQRIFALHGSDRLDGVSATDGFRSCLRKAEVLDLTFLNQVLHCACHFFDGHVGVNAMLIEEIDAHRC